MERVSHLGRSAFGQAALLTWRAAQLCCSSPLSAADQLGGAAV